MTGCFRKKSVHHKEMGSLSPNEKLLWALVDNDEEEAIKALDGDADANLLSPNGSSPLHAAALHCSGSLIKKLVEHNAKVNQADTEGYTPLMVAALNGRTDAVKALLDNGADATLTRCGNTGETALHMAMNGDSPEVVKALLDKGVDVDAETTEDMFTPLHYAAKYNSLKLCEILLEYKCRTKKDKKGRTPAEVARSENHHSLAEYLDMCTAVKNMSDKELVSAIITLDEEAAKMALEDGANANMSSHTGSCPLHHAALRDSASLISMLVEHKAMVDKADATGFTPLMVAALNGRTDAVAALLENGANPNKKRLNTGETALHMAMNSKSPGVVRALVFGGANVNAQTTVEKFAPQHYAAIFDAQVLTKELEKNPHFNKNLLDAHSRNAAQLFLRDNGSQKASIEEGQTWYHSMEENTQEEPPSEEVYKVTTLPRGKVLILNSVSRAHKDAEYRADAKDAADLEALFKKMGYETKVRDAATKQDTKEQLEKFQEDPTLQTMDSVVVCLLGYGFTMDKLCAPDNKEMTANEVYAYFTDEACIRLKGKPKLFLFDYARRQQEKKGSNQEGTGSQQGGDVSTMSHTESYGSTEEAQNVEVLRHRVSLYAEGVKADQQCDNRSLFVQSIVEIFEKNARTHDVEELATFVHISMKKKMGVTITTDSTTTKKFYLNPAVA